MLSELRSIEEDFHALADRFDALISHYAEDPPVDGRAEKLRRACDKATEAAALVRKYLTSLP
jgi:hypothetical protein